MEDTASYPNPASFDPCCGMLVLGASQPTVAGGPGSVRVCSRGVDEVARKCGCGTGNGRNPELDKVGEVSGRGQLDGYDEDACSPSNRFGDGSSVLPADYGN